MITANNVTKCFGKLKALNNVSVNFAKGNCIALMGPNGSGKTTLIKCILGMVVPTSGTITFQEENIQHHWLYRKHIGYMPQIGHYPENMSIGQIIKMIQDIRQPYTQQFDEELIQSFGLNKILNKRMHTLSGGTKQKVSATLAFLFNSNVFILDEPTAGLDIVSVEILKEKIKAETKKEKLIIITSHVLSDLDELVTEVMYMQEGSLLFHKNISQLKAETGEEKLSKAIIHVIHQHEQ
jgi:Cu-processing system ATP-binding protein